MFGKFLPALFLSFLILYLFPPHVLGVTIVIKAHPQQVTVLEEFEVVADVVGLEGSTFFYAKASGGDGFSEIQTYSPKTNSFLNYSGSSGKWEDHPEFTSNASGSATLALKMRFKDGAKTGSSQLKITLRRKGADSNLPDSESPITLTVNPAPTNTPVPSNTPTLTPTQTPTKTPTPRPATSTPKPTSTPQTNIVTNNSNGTILASTPEILGESTSTAISPSPTNIQENDLKVLGISTGAKVSLVVGLLFLGTAIMVFTREMSIKNSKSA